MGYLAKYSLPWTVTSLKVLTAAATRGSLCTCGGLGLRIFIVRCEYRQRRPPSGQFRQCVFGGCDG